MVDGEKLSAEEIAVAIQWRNLDKDALAKRLCLMLAQAGAAQIQVIKEAAGGACIMHAERALRSHEVHDDEDRGCKRPRTTGASS